MRAWKRSERREIRGKRGEYKNILPSLSRIQVTRKIPFISVHLVQRPKEKADSEDVLPCIDLKAEEGEEVEPEERWLGKQLSSSGGNWAESVQGVGPREIGGASCHGSAPDGEQIAYLKLETDNGRKSTGGGRGRGGGRGGGSGRMKGLAEAESGEKMKRKSWRGKGQSRGRQGVRSSPKP